MQNAKTLTGMTLAEVAIKLDEQLPPDAYKPVPGGAKLTDIDPNHMRKVLNEVFGVSGYGWGYEFDPDTIRSRTDIRVNSQGKEYTVIIVTLAYLNFWYKLDAGDEVVVCNIPATGSSENSNDAYALKGALTNAIGNAVSNIGFQQSVYLGKRDHRTVQRNGSSSGSGRGDQRSGKKPSQKRQPAPASQKPAPAPTPAPQPAAGNGDPGDYEVPFGTHKGTKLRDLSPSDLDWLANKVKPFNQTGKLAQAKAKAYLEAQASPAPAPQARPQADPPPVMETPPAPKSGNGYHGSEASEFVFESGRWKGMQINGVPVPAMKAWLATAPDDEEPENRVAIEAYLAYLEVQAVPA